MSDSLKQWEDLRKQARQIENEIDSKLLILSRQGGDGRSNSDDEIVSDKAPLLSGSDYSSDMFERLSHEIEQLLAHLTDLNARMAHYTDQLVRTPTATYTLQRHRDILTDYSKEFNKTRAMIQSQRDREQLLRPTTISMDNGNHSTTNKKTDLIMKEHEHLQNSENMVDMQINIAMRTRENMINQRTALKAIHSQMTTLANRFPIINSLVNRIGIKKRRDTMIIGSVIGVCLFLLIMYKFN